MAPHCRYVLASETSGDEAYTETHPEQISRQQVTFWATTIDSPTFSMPYRKAPGVRLSIKLGCCAIPKTGEISSVYYTEIQAWLIPTVVPVEPGRRAPSRPASGENGVGLSSWCRGPFGEGCQNFLRLFNISGCIRGQIDTAASGRSTLSKSIGRELAVGVQGTLTQRTC